MAVVEGKLFVVGGRDGLKTLNTVESYDPATRCWSSATPMITHRSVTFNNLLVINHPCNAGTVWVSACWEGRCMLSVVTTAGATSTLSRGDDDYDKMIMIMMMMMMLMMMMQV